MLAAQVSEIPLPLLLTPLFLEVAVWPPPSTAVECLLYIIYNGQ